MSGSEEQPLSGLLKTAPEDFVVVEVDPAGQRTDTEPYDFLKAFAVSGPVEAEELTEGGEDVVAELTTSAPDAAHADEDHAKEEPSEAITDKLSALLQSLDAQLEESHCTLAEVAQRSQTLSAQELHSLVVDTIKASGGACGRRGTTTGASTPPPHHYWWEEAFPLATRMNKAQRRLFHFAVRSRYAHIRSFGRPPQPSYPPAGGGAGEDVSAGVDPLFVFIAFLFGSSVAETVAQWAQLKAAASTTGKMTDEELEALQQLSSRLGGGVDATGLTRRGAEPLTRIQASFPQAACAGGCEGRGREGAGSHAVTGAALSEKDIRRAFHEVMRRFYPFIRCSVTEGRVTLSFSPPPVVPAASASQCGAGRAAKREREREGVADGEATRKKRRTEEGDGAAGDRYMYCIVRKHNLDTMEMKPLLAKELHVQEGSVCIAGMKDKRAVTYQRVSVPCASSAWLPTGGPVRVPWPSDPLGSYLDIITVSTDVSLRRPVQLGDLKGNRFTITLRNLRYQRPPVTAGKAAAEGPAHRHTCASAIVADLQTRLARVVANGFVNYFGQQRFSESANSLLDHTGLHLFAGRYVAAVRSIFRGCPEVYEGFPEKMDARHAPRNSRDCAAMAHGLRQTYRMYYSEHELTAEDVRQESALWAKICEKAICESVPYPLRSLWVYAGQSLFFNVAASFAAETLLQAFREGKRGAAETRRLSSQLYLPMVGGRIRNTSTQGRDGVGGTLSEEEERVLEGLVADAESHALDVLGLSRQAAFEVRRVAGVPVPGGWRRAFVVPQDVILTIPSATARERGSGPLDTATSDPDCTSSPDEPVVPAAVLSFYLPSSSYATVCLREVLVNDTWW